MTNNSPKRVDCFAVARRLRSVLVEETEETEGEVVARVQRDRAVPTTASRSRVSSFLFHSGGSLHFPTSPNLDAHNGLFTPKLAEDSQKPAHLASTMGSSTDFRPLHSLSFF